MAITKQLKDLNWINILLFYVLACGLSCLMTKVPNLIREIWTEAPFNWNHGIGLLVASIIGYRVFRQKRKTTLLGNSPLKSIIFSSIFLTAYTILGFSNKFGINTHLWAFIFCLMTLIYDLFEESVWRGFLNDSMNSIPTWVKGIITGILWGFWHLIIFDSFEQFGGLHVFVLLSIIISIIMAYAMDRTNSILVAASIHALMILRDINVTIICAIIWFTMVLLWNKNWLDFKKIKTIN